MVCTTRCKDPPSVVKFEPALTCIRDLRQCAAVKTKSLEMMLPPQSCIPLFWIQTWNGNCSMETIWPPIILPFVRSSFWFASAWRKILFLFIHSLWISIFNIIIIAEVFLISNYYRKRIRFKFETKQFLAITLNEILFNDNLKWGNFRKSYRYNI